MRWKIYNEDVLQWCIQPDDMFHAVLCDPPYNLESIQKRFGNKNSAPAQFGKDGAFSRVSKGFMGKEWDTDVAFKVETWAAIKEHMYPGALGMAFSSTRTYHRMAMAIEDAGFIIHPMIGWIQGQGLPKPTKDRYHAGYFYGLQTLKPSFEPICVFQKSHEGSQIDGILKYGTGLWNIENSKIGDAPIPSNVLEQWSGLGQVKRPKYKTVMHKGRWPANVVVSDYDVEPYNKFFYCMKANSKEKDAGLKYENEHPAIKPIDLCKWLAGLILPPEEYKNRSLLVPFSGTGSEMIGALIAGWDDVVGVELEKDSCITAIKRLEYWINNG